MLDSCAASSADSFGAAAIAMRRQGNAANLSATAELNATATMCVQPSSKPAASLTKVAALRGEKNSAASISCREIAARVASLSRSNSAAS